MGCLDLNDQSEENANYLEGIQSMCGERQIETCLETPLDTNGPEL